MSEKKIHLICSLFYAKEITEITQLTLTSRGSFSAYCTYYLLIDYSTLVLISLYHLAKYCEVYACLRMAERVLGCPMRWQQIKPMVQEEILNTTKAQCCTCYNQDGKRPLQLNRSKNMVSIEQTEELDCGREVYIF